MKDSPDIFEGIANGDLSDSVPGSDRIRSLDDAQAMVGDLIGRTRNGSELHFSVCLHSGKVIGMCAIYGFADGGSSARIGFWISKRYRRKGYGKEAVRMLVGMAFGDLGIEKVVAVSKASNLPSLALLRSLRFRDEEANGEVRAGEKALSLSRNR
jgi:RimJ/RimL family protein N-acetyltransferase